MSDGVEGDDRSEYSLVMPFVAVASKGGPFDDDAYVAGYEMGLLDAQLEGEDAGAAEMNIRSANREQADLLAMRHGFTASFTESPELPEWTWAEFRRWTPPHRRDDMGLAGIGSFSLQCQCGWQTSPLRVEQNEPLPEAAWVEYREHYATVHSLDER